MTQQSSFTFSGYQWDKESRVATFTYKIEHNTEVFNFTESLAFPKEYALSDVPEELLKNALTNLLLVIGISYYKLFCPQEIVLAGFTLNEKQATFWNTVYTKGLGEFFYQNKIDFRGLISFPVSGRDSGVATLPKMTGPVDFPRKDRALVGIGGGKDSIVTAELLKAGRKPFSSFVINQHPIREEVIKQIGSEVVIVTRKLDPLLFEFNKKSDVYNGHIPVSAQYAFIGFLAAILFDYHYVIVSNEHSANYGNVEYLGATMNHQWSKSLEFETLFQAYTKEFITSDVSYFSLLRQLTELAVVKHFVQYSNYFPHFSSCNLNFKITGAGAEKKWCGNCAKCAFAFVMLSAFLSKAELITIFGENLFAKESLLQIYQELLGVINSKPFDCVGTPEEVFVAFALAAEKGEYEQDIIMKYVSNEVLAKHEDLEVLKEQVFAKAPEHKIPEEFSSVIPSD